MGFLISKNGSVFVPRVMWAKNRWSTSPFRRMARLGLYALPYTGPSTA